ncbi:MAG: hypothetical protein RLZZ282_543 [Verrucomicrobiota bacterium]
MDSSDSPSGVFGDEGIGVGGGAGKGGQIVLGAGVTKGDADVAEETRALDAFDGRLRKQGAERCVIENEKIAQPILENGVPSVERELTGLICEAVPRAGVQARVAAIDAVADGRAELDGNRAFVFDGEERNTASGVELVRRGDGIGRAGRETARAFPAVVGHGHIGS